MLKTRRHLELLAPAKNADFGIEAINHGADAVYIGGPAFGARAKAPNTIADIVRLVKHAHRYHAEVFVALNTIFHDNELAGARELVQQLYDAEVDALIVQDMGLLEMDLPPIQLHASTQTDIRTVEKARFLDQVGFSQIVLARELDLHTIQKISAATTCNLEYFIHGALCVAFSGQCYISHAHTGRSANRGECSQECRLPFTLEDQKGRIIGKDKHFLSMKDNDQSANLRALIDAGVSSFKIEGRYKDLPYVKNATAHYRQLLDEILHESPELAKSSHGDCTYTFNPQPEKTFNRSATDYFANGRQADIGAFDTPKFSGESLGKVSKVGKDFFEVDTDIQLHNGDGVCFFDVHKELVGLRVNSVDGKKLYPNDMPLDIRRGMAVYRNRDHAFMRLLEKDSAQRKIAVNMILTETQDGFSLMVTDEAGFCATAYCLAEKQIAENIEKARASLFENLSKLGSTDFITKEIQLETTQTWFVPASTANSLRRDAIEQLQQTRDLGYQRPPRRASAEPPATYPDDTLSYLANVYNKKARIFYEKHGVKMIAAAYEANKELDEVPLMITKHCLRFSHGLCPKEAKGVIGVQGTVTAEPMTLINGNDRFTLKFDCKPCEMHVMGKIRKPVLKMGPPQTIKFLQKIN
ncbi:MAG: U32 family peptidase [Methylotenera sp.]|uniref:peptidase U32 family protein n=1 Tax=Methylotenera sp. TaxID=2051956 RepID=UPI002720C898|nr:U32 family peptidase [Methylotenera sp.]MDO9394799.1 U32 family peptidase [Methylotenera sp.]MDP1523169.1 U32 family peptidase [Methylotenera sp.]MDP2070094.1 U32 family peptidase [Methylotenera sp.]MDP2229982.1 U32 family peptidase [Methylotenera sp.]MDP3819431.1 U32 family peptidase [Methylotenera sp.]